MAFRKVTRLDDLWPGEMLGVDCEGTAVLLVNTGGVISAFENKCAHKAVPMSQGLLEGATLTCSAHHWQYDAVTGRGINPVRVCLKRFAVRIEGGDIWVDPESSG